MAITPELGRAVLQLAADNRQFLADVEKSRRTAVGLGDAFRASERQAKSLAQEMDRAGRKAAGSFDAIERGAKRMGGAIAAGLSVAAVTATVNRYVQHASQINDLASKAGMAVEPFQKLSYAIKLNGGSMEDASQAAVIMGRNLATGSKAVRRAVSEIGLDINKLRTMDPADAFSEIGDAIAKIPNPLKQSQLAMEIFGRSGASLLPAMKGNLRETGEEAQRLGLVLKKDAVEAADRFGDAVEQLKAKGTALAGEALTPLLEHATKLVDTMLDLPDPVKRSAAAMVTLAGGLWAVNAAASAIGAGSALGVLRLLAAHPALAALAAGGIGVGMVYTRGEQMKRDLDASVKPRMTEPWGREGEILTVSEAERRAAERRGFNPLGQTVRVGGRAWNWDDDETRRAKQEAAAAAQRAFDAWWSMILAFRDTIALTTRETFRGVQEASAWFGTLPRSTAFSSPLASRGIGGMMASLPFTSPGNLSGLPSTTIGYGYMGGPPAAVYGNMSGGQVRGGGPGWFAGLGASLRDLGPTILGAIMGGGNVGQAAGGLLGGGLFGGIAEKLSGTLVKTLGSTIGGALGSVIPGLGTILGSGIGKLFSGLFGKSKGWYQDREADKTLDALRADLLDTYGSLEEIDRLGKEVGVDLAGAWGDRSAKGLEHFNGLLDEFKKKLAIKAEIDALQSQLSELQQSQVPTWDQVGAAIDRYGGSVAGMGQAIQQLNVTARATQIINDFELLTKAGASAATVARLMKKDLNALVQDSIKYGSALPANMKPVIESLAAQGLLFDANGEKITDVSKLKWGEPVESEADKVNKAMQALIAKIDELVRKLGGLDGTEVDTTVNVHYEPDGAPPPAPGPRPNPDPNIEPPTMHEGGPVTRALRRAHQGLFIGSLANDEVPLIGQVGEEMVSKPVTSLARWAVNQIRDQGASAGGGGGTVINAPITVAIDVTALDGNDLQTKIERDIAPVLADAIERGHRGLRTRYRVALGVA